MICFYNTKLNNYYRSHRINKLPTMYTVVSLQVTAAIERFITHVARKRTLSIMYAFMFPESTLITE